MELNSGDIVCNYIVQFHYTRSYYYEVNSRFTCRQDMAIRGCHLEQFVGVLIRFEKEKRKILPHFWLVLVGIQLDELSIMVIDFDFVIYM